MLLVASGLLSGLDHLLVLAFLAATYVLWGAGLRANLRANWLLLRRTGTSTNALSKAAFELTRRRGSAHAEDRGGRGLRRHRARQGGALLRRSRVTVRRHVRERTFSREVSLSVAGARQMRPQLRPAAPRRREAHSAP